MVRTDHNDQLSEWPEQPERFDQQGERVESRDQPQKVRQPRRMRRNSFAGLFVFFGFFLMLKNMNAVGWLKIVKFSNR